jgi:hypothetical protein
MQFYLQYCIPKVKRKLIKDEPADKCDEQEFTFLNEFWLPGQDNHAGAVLSVFSNETLKALINSGVKKM